MPNLSHEGTCEHCGAVFGFRLIHNGLNETAYAYCDTCGGAALLDTYREDRAGIPRHRAIDPQGEDLLAPCACGGTFAAMAKPRCPTCRAGLDADIAASYIEAAITPVAAGWKWQGDWRGLYCLIIDEHVQLNPWKPGR